MTTRGICLPGDLKDLYRAESLRKAGVPVVCSSDAPFGPADPWAVMKAAAQRRTPGGEVLGENERLTVRVRCTATWRARSVRVGRPGRSPWECRRIWC